MFNELKKNSFILDQLPFYLIIFLPVFLVSGSFLPDLAISLCSILFLINCYKKKITKYFKTKFFLFFILFSFYLILSSLLSNNIFFSLGTSAFYFRFIIFSLCIWYLLEINSLFLLKNLYYILCIIIFSLFIDGSYQFFFGVNIFGYKIIDIYRVSSFFGDELIMGSFVSRLFPLIIGINFYLREKEKSFFFNQLFLNIITLCCLTLIIYSGERSSFVYFLISFFLIILFDFLKFKNFLIFCIFFIFISFLILPNFGTRIFVSTKDQIFEKTLNKNIHFFSKTHEGHYLSALKIFKDNKIFGSGPKTFRLLCNEDRYSVSKNSCVSHPHHSYIQILSETGLLGFCFLILIFLFICIKILKLFYLKFFQKEKIDIFFVSVISMFLISLWPLTPSGNFFHNWLSIIYYFPAGIYMWLVNKN